MQLRFPELVLKLFIYCQLFLLELENTDCWVYSFQVTLLA